MTTSLRILGIDPGLNITGYGVLEADGGRLRLCEAGVIRGKSRGSLAKRLVEIHDGTAEVIAGLKPDVMALEELYSHYDRPRTAILMGHARGVICLAAAKAGIPIKHYAATQIKRILTGSGRAEVANAAHHPARVGPGGPARAARRGRRTGRCTLSFLSEGQANAEDLGSATELPHTSQRPAVPLRLRCCLRPALGLLGRRQQFRWPTNDLITGFSLNAPQILADQLQVAAELAGVLHAVTPNFIDNGIVHRTASNNSSGEQTSGQL